MLCIFSFSLVRVGCPLSSWFCQFFVHTTHRISFFARFFAWHEMKWNQMQIWDVRCVWVLHATTGQHGIITALTLAIWKQKMGYGDLCHRAHTHTPSTNINLFAEDVELPTNYLVARRVSIPRHRLPPHRTAPHHITSLKFGSISIVHPISLSTDI